MDVFTQQRRFEHLPCGRYSSRHEATGVKEMGKRLHPYGADDVAGGRAGAETKLIS